MMNLNLQACSRAAARLQTGLAESGHWPASHQSRGAARSGTKSGAAVSAQPAAADIAAALSRYSKISLEETNQSAAMLKRVDNKYVFNRSTLLSLLEDLSDEFRVLELEWRNVFSYKSCYFDDNSRCFKEHQQGRRQRFKVRTRLYVESDKAFFEVKLKGGRGQTEKTREKCANFDSFEINDQQLQMLCDLYENTYKKPFVYRLKPALHVDYRRFTLVSAVGGERVTVDIGISFGTRAGKRVEAGDDFVILETKSRDGRGKSDSVMRRAGIRPARGCSKYCLGMVLAGEVGKHNNFLPIVKAIRSRMQGLGDGTQPAM